MKIAFLIMAYKDPLQIERLVKKMNHPSFHFFLHVDAKFDLTPYEFLDKYENLTITSTRRKIYWAGFRFTETVLKNMEEILMLGTRFDFVSLISGQDYPIKPVSKIAEYYSNNLGKTFFSLVDSDDPWWSHAITRVNQYHMTNYTFRGRYILQYMMNYLLPKRKLPVLEKLYGGPRATFWTMSSSCAHYVVDFMKRNKKLRNFAKFTWAPDEFLIHSIIMNSEFSDSVINDSGVYIDWSLGGSNPKILTVDDFDKLRLSNKLTARKFDINVDTDILDLIDLKLLDPKKHS